MRKEFTRSRPPPAPKNRRALKRRLQDRSCLSPHYLTHVTVSSIRSLLSFPTHMLKKLGIIIVALAAFVFVAGVTLGFGIGYFLQDEDTSIARSWLKKEGSSPRNGEGPSVRVRRSETAIAEFEYAEPDAVPLPPALRAARLGKGHIEDPHTASLPASDPDIHQRTLELEEENTLVSPPSSDQTLPLNQSPSLNQSLWRQNARSLDYNPDQPMIAIVIDDLGIDQKRTRQTIALEGLLTLAFIPYGRNLEEHVTAAQAAGHEIMLHLPMEPLNPEVDPGPNALLTSHTPDELNHRLNWAFSQFSGIVGVNNHMGSRFTAWPEGMQQVTEVLKRKGLLFLDSITTQDTVAYKITRQNGVPTLTRDIFLDHDESPEAIAQALDRIELIALAQGRVVAIGHPYDTTLAALAEWIPTLKQKGIQLVPISLLAASQPPPNG